NEKMNISSIVEEKEIIIRHFLDSLSPIPILRELNCWDLSNKYVDLGCGGGFPGVPIKIVEPEINIDFAEVNKKKVCFLNEVILNLKLYNTNIVDSSTGKVNEDYNVIITRAFGSIKKIVQEAKKYFKENGKIIAYKGKEDKVLNEINELSNKYKNKLIFRKVITPFLNEERHIIIIKI
ncbi:MAG: 16S rRNA (guanine(527)-N(7))-methyltransferase RsmG, partial [Spirochaetota bacterium]|nr:16S rRNA (guanine(527)-N(7))-methyltransferase RsmG [Spirochaetota bacterium]